MPVLSAQVTTATSTTAPTRVLGCDVGKASIVVFDSKEEHVLTLPNTP